MAEMQFEDNVSVIIRRCMNIQHDEGVLIIADSNTRNIGDALLKAAEKVTSRVKYTEIPVGKVHGEEPDDEVAEEMLDFDVVLIATTKSISHTKARRDASSNGVRIASMPGINESMINRCIDVDYDSIKILNEKLKSILEKAEKIRVTTAFGTDVSTSLSVVKCDDTGLLHEKGSFGNLPAGEVDSGVKEDSTNGVIVFDASISGIGGLDSPLKINVRNGYAVSIEGKESERLKRILDNIGKKAYKIAEFGIGTNPKATITGRILEDEKVLGTAHFALGNDLSYKGNNDVPVHLDGIMTKPTIYIDDKKIMEDGKLILD